MHINAACPTLSVACHHAPSSLPPCRRRGFIFLSLKRFQTTARFLIVVVCSSWYCTLQTWARKSNRSAVDYTLQTLRDPGSRGFWVYVHRICHQVELKIGQPWRKPWLNSTVFRPSKMAYRRKTILTKNHSKMFAKKLTPKKSLKM